MLHILFHINVYIHIYDINTYDNYGHRKLFSAIHYPFLSSIDRA